MCFNAYNVFGSDGLMRSRKSENLTTLVVEGIAGVKELMLCKFDVLAYNICIHIKESEINNVKTNFCFNIKTKYIKIPRRCLKQET